METSQETWKCISNCGACCYLQPDERPELEQYLTLVELTQYLSMVGEDGWCIHFNQTSRQCNIYRDRPRFCRVQPDTFQAMYGIAPDELDEFAIDCCHQQISSMYGSKSREMEAFNHAIDSTATTMDAGITISDDASGEDDEL